MPSRHLSTRSIALGAMAALFAFPVLVIAANIAQRDSYNAESEAVSNLALGQGGWLMTMAFVALGTGTLLVAAMVRRLASRAIVGPVLLTAGASTTFLSAVFQTDAEGANPTLHGTIHMALGVGSFLLVVASIAACTITFLRSGSRRGVGMASAVCGLAAIGGAVMTFALPDSLFGIGQRAFLAAAIAWMLMISVVALKTSREHGRTFDAMTSEAVAGGAKLGSA